MYSKIGIAANILSRKYLGIDQENEFLEISKNRKLEIENPKTAELYSQLSNSNSIGILHKEKLFGQISVS